VASAPGKIVLSGEYAVLDGAPAIAVAVDRRAQATVQDSTDGECHVASPGFAGGQRFGIVDAVFGGRPPCRIQLDTRAFSDSGRKIGIGSSAALTAALVAAMTRSEDVFVKALLAHSEFQGGIGSGVDVAVAVHGGLIEYTMTTRGVRRLEWPAGLGMRVLWSGVAASTKARLQKLDSITSRPSRTALVRSAAAVAGAWGAGEATQILDRYVDYIGRLRDFGVDHDLGIFDAGHDVLTEAAMQDGLVYKPAGAGGGDVGVLFGRSDDELDAFIARRARLIHGVVPCAPDALGVRLEQT
jgi:phosphomevalonate kinase